MTFLNMSFTKRINPHASDSIGGLKLWGGQRLWEGLYRRLNNLIFVCGSRNMFI